MENANLMFRFREVEANFCHQIIQHPNGYVSKIKGPWKMTQLPNQEQKDF